MAGHPLTLIGARLASKVLNYSRIKERNYDYYGRKYSVEGY